LEKAGIKDKVEVIGGKMVVRAQDLFEDVVDNLNRRPFQNGDKLDAC
jgi:hypothetical protein